MCVGERQYLFKLIVDPHLIFLIRDPHLTFSLTFEKPLKCKKKSKRIAHKTTEAFNETTYSLLRTRGYICILIRSFLNGLPRKHVYQGNMPRS